jgi:ribosomal-protein-alanine N-acetyltransferase
MARVMSHLRQMTPDDIDDVMALEEATFPSPWSRRMLTDELGAPGRHYVVVEGPDGLEAYGGIMVSDDEGHVMTVAVDPERRGRGIGSRLMVALLRAALDMGATRMLLEVRPSNMDARRLYRRFGFVPVDIRPRYYRDEDAIVMWVDDADTPAFAERLQRMDRPWH